MLVVRSFLFNTLFFPWTFLASFMAQLGIFFGQAYVVRIAYLWGVGVHSLLIWFVGMRYEIRGQGNWDGKPGLIACKHESTLETSAIQMLCYNAAIVLKKELTWIPLFGHSTILAGVIPINRSKGRSVLPQIVEGAKRFFTQGRSLFLFPEGTRRDAHVPTSLKPGIATLYDELNVPVYPIALNTGLVWGRRSFIKRPGRVIYEFLPPIMPGLSKQDFLEKLTQVLEEGRVRLQEEVKGETPKPRLSNGGLLSIGVLLLLGLIYTGLWYASAHKLEAQLSALKTSLQEKGISLSFVHKDTKGFPFHIKAHLEEVRLSHPLGAATCSGVLTIGAHVFSPLLWHLETQDKTILTLAAADRRLESASLHSTVNFNDLATFSVNLAKPQLIWQAGEVLLCAYDLSLNHTHQDAASHQTLILNMTHPKGTLLPIDDTQLVHLEANLTKPLTSLKAQHVAQWQKDGGTVDITDFHLVTPPLDLKAQATLTLDAHRHLEGSASLYATGVDAFLDTLTQNGKVSFLAAQGYKLAFHLATTFSQKKGVPTKDGVTAVSLSLQDNTLSLGQTPILPVPSIVLSDPWESE